VRCVNANFKDGFGQDVARSTACFDEGKAVVIKIIDSCPCVHANYYSNQRCGGARGAAVVVQPGVLGVPA
jgi:hypothetical protein